MHVSVRIPDVLVTHSLFLFQIGVCVNRKVC